MDDEIRKIEVVDIYIPQTFLGPPSTALLYLMLPGSRFLSQQWKLDFLQLEEKLLIFLLVRLKITNILVNLFMWFRFRTAASWLKPTAPAKIQRIALFLTYVS